MEEWRQLNVTVKKVNIKKIQSKLCRRQNVQDCRCTYGTTYGQKTYFRDKSYIWVRGTVAFVRNGLKQQRETLASPKFPVVAPEARDTGEMQLRVNIEPTALDRRVLTTCFNFGSGSHTRNTHLYSLTLQSGCSLQGS